MEVKVRYIVCDTRYLDIEIIKLYEPVTKQQQQTT